MSTVQEIKAAIEMLSLNERAELERLLRETGVSQPARSVTLPNQAARRRRILGDKILPNMVLEEREAESK
jgi:hypothetical protein